MNYQELYETLINGIVVIINNETIGTGFIVDKKGYIATANHVVAGNDDVQIMAVYTIPNTIPAKVIKRDPSLDFALLQVAGEITTPIVELGNSSSVRVGDEIVIIGFPFGKSVWGVFIPAIHRGIVSGIVKIAQGQSNQLTDRFQLDIMANPGNSGGPLALNKNGKVIGVLSRIIYSYPVGQSTIIEGKPITSSTGIAMAIPMDYFKEMIKDI